MIRRRAGTPGSDDETKYGKRSPANRSSNEATTQHMVSNLFVLAFVAFFIAAGFLKHHYHESRSRDPFAAGASAKQPPQQERKDLEQKDIIPKENSSKIKQSSLLSEEEDAALERDSAGRRYHLIFSTDCSPYQHWQSYLVYYTAMKVRQPGHVTRIASGCEGDEAAAMEEWFRKDVQFMSPKRFHLQLTPSFSTVMNEKGEVVGDYKFFNKPFGLKFWMEHSPQLGFNSEVEGTSPFLSGVDEDIVILIDPDMGLLRPITADFSDERETVISSKRREHIITTVVGPGKPAAQEYGFGAEWMDLDLVKVTGDINTPAAKVSKEDGRLFYPVGPPYLAAVVDMYEIAIKWSEFVPRAYEDHPHLLAEMFAFCIAAAHLELPHQIVDSLMISDIHSGEGWPLIDKIPANDVCEFAFENPDHSKYALPNVVHLCQRYAMGEEWFFGKRAIPGDVNDCASPLFAKPPSDLATRFNFMKYPNGGKVDLTPQNAAREAFMICYLNGAVNEAATFYKQNACDPATINLEQTRNLYKEKLAADAK